MSKKQTPHISILRAERGSVAIIGALAVAVIAGVLSMSQSVTTMLANRTLDRKLTVGTGKRANGSSLNVLDTLFSSRIIDVVIWPPPRGVEWRATINSTPLWGFDTAGPTLSVQSCNPRSYPADVTHKLSLEHVAPNPNACVGTAGELSSQITFGAVVNGGVYVAGRPWFVGADIISSVIARAAIGPNGVAVTDNARLTLPLPIPDCTLDVSPQPLVDGDPAKLLLTQSLNVTSLSITSTTPGDPDFPLREAASPYTVHPRIGVTYIATVTGPGGSRQCRVTPKVYPPPRCAITASPPQLGIGEYTTLTMTTSNNTGAYSPIFSAILDGTSVSINGGTKQERPATSATYAGSVQGVNGHSAACQVTVPISRWCSISANPVRVTQYETTWFTFSPTPALVPNISSVRITGTGLNNPLPRGGGSFPFSPQTLGVHTYNISITDTAGETHPGCAMNLQVVPGCPFTNSRYYTTGSVSPFGMVNIGLGAPAPGWAVGVKWTDPPTASIPVWCGGNPGLPNNGLPADSMCILQGVTPCDPEGHCGGFGVLVHNISSPACYAQYPMMERDHSCFPPETKLRLADGGTKRADQITSGDRLRNPVNGRALTVRRIITGPELIPLYELGWAKTRLRVSRTHPIFTDAGPRQAWQLKVGDRILGEDKAFHALTIVRNPPVKKNQRVINFELDSYLSDEPNDHAVAAEGVIAGDYTLQNILDNKPARKPWPEGIALQLPDPERARKP